jgi:hypothetical protein
VYKRRSTSKPDSDQRNLQLVNVTSNGRYISRYGLGDPGIESRWERDLPHLSLTALGPTQPTVQGVLGIYRSRERQGRDVDPSTPSWSRKGRAIALLPLWAVRPVQSLSACTKGALYRTACTEPQCLNKGALYRTACTEPQCLYNGALYRTACTEPQCLYKVALYRTAFTEPQCLYKFALYRTDCTNPLCLYNVALSRTAFTQPQCLYNGALYLYLYLYLTALLPLRKVLSVRVQKTRDVYRESLFSNGGSYS